jgi:Sec-independent protein translocase protein TatA
MRWDGKNLMDHPVWVAIQQHVVKHLGVYTENLLLLVIAAISTSPEKIPATAQDFWSWIREALRTATPARFGQQAVSTHTQIVTATATTPARLEQQTETVPTKAAEPPKE